MKINIFFIIGTIVVLFFNRNCFSQTNTATGIVQTNIVNVQFPSPLAITNTLSVEPEKNSLELLRQAVRDHTIKDVFLLIFGAIIAGVIGFCASLVMHKLEVRDKKNDDLEFRNNALRAIRWELEALSKIYDAGIGGKLKEFENGEFLPWKLSLTQDWFTVFNANTVHLGKIEAEISRQMITVHALAKALIEEYRINNIYLNEREQIELRLAINPQDAYFNALRPRNTQLLKDQFERIKITDKALKESTAALFALLDNHGIR
jgi:hypothetical protein